MSVARKRPPVQGPTSAAEPAPVAPEIQPTAGVSIREAICRYAADQGAVLRWREDAVFRGDQAERFAATLRYMAYTDHLRTELLSYLSEGKLLATGVWDAEASRRPIPADKLDGAEMDEIKSQITIAGHIIHDVKITQARPTDRLPPLSPRAERQKRVTVSPAKIRGWYLQEAERAGGWLDRETAIKACVLALACTREAARTAFTNLPNQLKQPPHRPPKQPSENPAELSRQK